MEEADRLIEEISKDVHIISENIMNWSDSIDDVSTKMERSGIPITTDSGLVEKLRRQLICLRRDCEVALANTECCLEMIE